MNGEISLQEFCFQFKAQEDVEVIGDFIGLDADEGAFHRVRSPPALLVVVASEVGKSLDEVGPPGFPEGAGAADTVFPKAGLGFVNTEGGGLAQGGTDLRFGETLIVETVAGLVEDPVEGDHEVGFVVTGGHAGIARTKARAEGVGAGVEPAGSRIESDFGQEGLEEFPLVGARVVTAKVFTGRVRGNGKSFFGDRDQAGAKFGKERSDIAGEPTWFVAFEEGIVRLVGVAPEVGHLAGEREKLFEVGGKGGEVGVFAGFEPSGAGESDGELVFFDQFGRDAGGSVVVVPPTGKGGSFGRVGGKRNVFALVEPMGDVGVGGEAVGDAGEEGGLFGTEGVAFWGEDGFLIPREEAGGGAEQGEVFPSGRGAFRRPQGEGTCGNDETRKGSMECFLSGEGNRSRLPKSFDGGIFTNLGVTGKDGHFFSQTLGDENTIERIAMMKGKVNRATDMAPRDGKWFCDLLIDPLFSEAL